MLRELSSTQLGEWEAFYQLEPWGFDIESTFVGQVCATIARFAGRQLADGVQARAEDFALRIRRPERLPRDLSGEIHAGFSALFR